MNEQTAQVNISNTGSKLQALQAKYASKKLCINGTLSHKKNKYGKCSDCGKTFAVKM